MIKNNLPLPTREVPGRAPAAVPILPLLEPVAGRAAGPAKTSARTKFKYLKINNLKQSPLLTKVWQLVQLLSNPSTVVPLQVAIYPYPTKVSHLYSVVEPWRSVVERRSPARWSTTDDLPMSWVSLKMVVSTLFFKRSNKSTNRLLLSIDNSLLFKLLRDIKVFDNPTIFPLVFVLSWFTAYYCFPVSESINLF